MRYKNKVQLGRYLEGKVAEYLQNLDYKIIAQNYSINHGEIDIIAKENTEIVFVEVKSLKNEDFISLEQTISSKKRQNLIRSCSTWLMNEKLEDIDWRIDFVGVVSANGKDINKLTHIKNAIF